MKMRMTLLAGVAALALSPAAFAQDSNEPVLPPAQEQAPAEQMPMDSQGAPSDPTVSQPASDSGAIGDVVVEPAVTPPPAEAVIQAQRPNEMRTENLIGTF